jgi:phosphate starvation-inducible protein PhoH
MTRRNRKSNEPNKFQSSLRPMKRKKPLNLDCMRVIEPLTENQEKLFNSYDEEKNLVAYGCAGTGKSFAVLYKALKEVLNENTPYEKVYICRSIVATREPGALPGDLGEKTGVFEIPYKNMVKYMFEMPDDPTFEMLYSNLKHQNTIEFLTTSFIRGVTLDRCIIIVDEFQNANFHELCSVITRVGVDTKIMFCGDATQSDFIKTSEKNGIIDFMRIIQTMPSFDIVEFGIEDVVRSGLCKEFLIAKNALGL